MSIGVNLAGAEFGSQDRYGTDYIYPGIADLDYYASKGMTLVRLPFKWERMQPDLAGDLSDAEISRMVKFLDSASQRGIGVIIDLHNFGRYKGDVLGTAELPASAFAQFWGKLAAALDGHSALAGYGLMNEPHHLGGSEVWPAAAQAGIDAIRNTDRTTPVYVAGNNWSAATRWDTDNPGFPLKDPAASIVYEAHVYFDHDQTGSYQGGYDAEAAYPNVGVDRVKPFLDWLAANNAKGFIGEFGVPDDDPRWLVVLDRFLNVIEEAGVGGTYWAAGPWWGEYKLSVQPGPGGFDAPQMAVLEKYASRGPEDGVFPGSIEEYGFTISGSMLVVTDHFGSNGSVALADVTKLTFDGKSVLLRKGTVNADVLTGAVGVDLLLGFRGSDVLMGRLGKDILDGGAGSDTAIYSGTLSVKLKLNGGTASTVYLGGIESDRIRNIEKVTTGSGADKLIGNSGANTFKSGAGADFLSGGLGKDTMWGQLGSDRFDFNSIAESRVGAAGRDVIGGWDPGDKLDIAHLDASTARAGDQDFKFVGKGTVNNKIAEGDIKYYHFDGDTYVVLNQAADNTADFQIFIHGIRHLTEGNFLGLI